MERVWSILLQSNIVSTVRAFLDRALERPAVTVVELLLIGAVVYTVLRFLQGTRGARLIRAVLTIVVSSFALVWLIAERFGLERINAIYPYFLLGVFLVSLVAFQTELRRILMRLGEGGWLQRFTKPRSVAIDPIIQAVERLARRKVGALIAIERSTEVGAVTDSGIRIDAALSCELLETIFHPGTPLHDLGVIVRQERILAAGCQFPLVESGEVDRSLGSRHRAGIGLSYEADAIVVIVSEETGSISLAVRGVFERSISSERLRKQLIEELSASRIQVIPETRSADAEPTASKDEVATNGTSQTA
ncbi:MAG: diadenylate cyclase CdaA [Phycisphaerae bacterium]